MTRRRWIADTWDAATAALHGDQAQHLSRVLRAQPGMEFDVVAGGHAWLARIASIDRDLPGPAAPPRRNRLTKLSQATFVASLMEDL